MKSELHASRHGLANWCKRYPRSGGSVSVTPFPLYQPNFIRKITASCQQTCPGLSLALPGICGMAAPAGAGRPPGSHTTTPAARPPLPAAPTGFLAGWGGPHRCTGPADKLPRRAGWKASTSSSTEITVFSLRAGVGRALRRGGRPPGPPEGKGATGPGSGFCGRLCPFFSCRQPARRRRRQQQQQRVQLPKWRLACRGRSGARSPRLRGGGGSGGGGGVGGDPRAAPAPACPARQRPLPAALRGTGSGDGRARGSRATTLPLGGETGRKTQPSWKKKKIKKKN